MSRGMLIVVSGPSGCGKGTILQEVLRKGNRLFYSISATTRIPRPGEVEGENYFFLTKDAFERLIEENGMLEHAVYCGNYYGTPRAAVEERLEQGCDVILEIEVQGAMQIKKSCPDALFLFILPPSVKELRRRLEKRGTETEERIAGRIAAATDEIAAAPGYDYIIVNDGLEDAIEDFLLVLRAERLSSRRSAHRVQEVLQIQ